MNPETKVSENRIFLPEQMCRNKLVSQLLYWIKDERNQNIIFFGHDLNNIGFPTKGKLIRSNSVMVSMRFRIQRIVTAPLEHVVFGKWCGISMEKRGKGRKVSV